MSARTVRRTLATTAGALAVVLLLSACAASGNDLAGTPAADGEVAGFWLGLWHGFIVPVTFIVSLFTDTVGIYEVHNSGGWYDFGFLLGASATLGGSAGGGAAGRRSRH